MSFYNSLPASRPFIQKSVKESGDCLQYPIFRIFSRQCQNLFCAVLRIQQILRFCDRSGKYRRGPGLVLTLTAQIQKSENKQQQKQCCQKRYPKVPLKIRHKKYLLSDYAFPKGDRLCTLLPDLIQTELCQCVSEQLTCIHCLIQSVGIAADLDQQ